MATASRPALFQLARAYTTFARDGEVIPVTLQRRGEPDPVHGIRPRPAWRASCGRCCKWPLARRHGTRCNGPGLQRGRQVGHRHKQVGKTYVNKYRSWFVGISPIDKPRIVVAVMVDEPSTGVYYGGKVAGPVFSQVVAQTLRLMQVPPDLDVKSQIVASKAPAVEESF